LAAYLAQLQTARPRTPTHNWGQLDALLAQTFEKALRGEATPQAALDAAAEAAGPLLE
jgi:ABC-type glycerol-3-phosphate transport system substrate-binding protein